MNSTSTLIGLGALVLLPGVVFNDANGQTDPTVYEGERIGTDPDSSLIEAARLISAGIGALNTRRVDEAIALFSQAAKINSPRRASAYLQLGLALIAAHRYAEAVSALEQAKQLGLQQKPLQRANLALVLARSRAGAGAVQTVQQTPKNWNINLLLSAGAIDGISVPATVDNAFDPARESDARYLMSFGAEYALPTPLFKQSWLAVAANLQQILYNERKDLDFSSANGSLYFRAKPFERLDARAGFDYTRYRLDDEKYSQVKRASVSAFVKESKSIYGRVSVSFADTDFDELDSQDSESTSVNLSQHVYFGRKKHHASLGAAYSESDAELERFSYSLARGYLSSRFNLTSRQSVTAYIAYDEYEYKDFDILQPDIIRKDEIWSASLKYALRFKKQFEIFVSALYSDHASNIERQDYISRWVAVGLEANF